MSSFELPNYWAKYHSAVIERSRLLIEKNIWQGIQLTNFEGWLLNFKTDGEQYLSACLLDSLSYRTRPQINSMYKYMFNVLLPNYCKTKNITLLNGNNAYFAPLDSGFPGKSEQVYFRAMCDAVHIHDKNRVTITQKFLDDQPRLPVFLIDDFCGTGDGFFKFSSKFDLKKYPNILFYYLPLISHEKGAERIKNAFTNVVVLSVEKITQKNCVFDASNGIFCDYKWAKTFYEAYAGKMKLKGTNLDPLGYGELGLALAFEDSIPNGTLPVFWSNKMKGPLIPR